MVHILDSFFLLRPVVLIPVWGFCLFGYVRGKRIGLADVTPLWTHPLTVPFFWIVMFSLSVGCVYIMNQIADRDVDKKNGGLPLLASGIISSPRAWGMVILSGGTAIVYPLAAGHATIAWLSASAIILGWAYSFKPFYFSGRPVADFLANAVGFGAMAFGCGWHLAGRSLADVSFLIAAFPYVLLMCAGSISSTLPDIPGDAVLGKRTTAVHWGPKKAHLLATTLLFAAISAGVVSGDWLIVLCGGAAFPLYILYLAQPTIALMEATYKIGGASSMIVAALFSPALVAAGGITVLATWMYFRYRHHVAYPSLVPLRSGSDTPA